MARRLILALRFVLLVVVAAACSEDEPVFDPSIVIEAVQAEVDPVGIEAVACEALATDDPSIADLPEFGGEVDCVGTLHGDPVDLLVTIGPALDGRIAVAAEIRTDLFDVAAAEVGAAGRLDADLGGAPEVVCAERLVVTAPGRRIECRVTADGGTAGPVDRVLTIVIVDDEGNWEIELFG
ncbi:MAG: hypothetical protein AAGA90_19340 [Actinomycetota bacterium]